MTAENHPSSRGAAPCPTPAPDATPRAPSLTDLSLVSEPGDAAVPNEDFALATPGLAVVLDGVTPMDRSDTGCRHGVAWHARTLGLEFARRASVAEHSLTDALAAAITATAAAHADTCDLTHPDSPAATVAAVRQRGDLLDYLVLSDAVVVLDLGEQEPRVVTDGRAGEVGRRLRTAGEVPSAPRVRAHRNRVGGYWVAAQRPEAAYEALTGTVPMAAVHQLVVASDGATRLVDTFGHDDWPQALDFLRTNGPAAWIARTRAAERAAPAQRGKRHDDATLVVATVRR